MSDSEEKKVLMTVCKEIEEQILNARVRYEVELRRQKIACGCGTASRYRTNEEGSVHSNQMLKKEKAAMGYKW